MDRIRRMLLAAPLLAATLAVSQEDIDVKPAMGVAEAWLAALDAGRYGQGWEEAAPMFRDAMPKVQWQTTMESVRLPLGAPLSRKLRQALYTRTLPNAPAGEYVVIQYDTRFEHRPLSTEIVTPVRGRDGTWRVSDYTLR
jgi:hypothetical protein